MSSHPLDLADEKTDPVPPPEIVEAVEVSRDPKFERRTMLWVDLRILPILAIIQCFSTTEPHNLGSAYAAGLDKALELTVGVRYSIITCIFFVPHILLQLPSNMVLRWIGVRELMTSLILAWGAAQLGMGFVKNWQQLLITRLLLGIFGAPFNGVILFLVSSWYLRHEFQKRLAALAIVITLGTSFSPLLAYGLSLLDGKGGLEGWRWIFIVEGILTVVLGVLTFFFIPGFPDENKFLNAEQTAFVIKRINEDRGDALPDAITVRQVAVHLRDWTLWAYGIIALCSSMSGTVVVYFLPIILTGMGYDLKGTLLRAAAVAISGIPVACLLAYLADKLKHRGSFIIILALISTTGCVLTAWHPKAKIRFFGTFLINLGGLSAAPTIIAYGANNVVSHSKRAVQSALFMTMVSAGGIVGATVFRNQDRPTYVPGLIAVLLSQLLVVTLSGLLMIRHAYWNRRALEGKLDKPLEGQPGFLYTL